jgi:hypothetical protein
MDEYSGLIEHKLSACRLSGAAGFGAGLVVGWSAVEFAGDQE